MWVVFFVCVYVCLFVVVNKQEAFAIIHCKDVNPGFFQFLFGWVSFG